MVGGWCWFIVREKYCWLTSSWWLVLIWWERKNTAGWNQPNIVFCRAKKQNGLARSTFVPSWARQDFILKYKQKNIPQKKTKRWTVNNRHISHLFLLSAREVLLFYGGIYFKLRYVTSDVFFITQYNSDTHNVHTPLWTHVRKSYPYEHLRRLSRQILVLMLIRNTEYRLIIKQIS